MQDAILRLTTYWVGHGAVLAQPYNTEVGAGTLNPATFLRVLGPEPWCTAYVEPSVRPDDSRYGENPNRLQTHTQFQVILKPDPGNSQELYLGSIRALGIDTVSHDVRFVEDNWEAPAIGSWGLGWEVWLDGLEITQFTYFQAAGGLTLEPVSVEITYGLERILMSLQGVDHFKKIAFAPGVSYGEIFAQPELEMSTYYLDEADVAAQRQLFEIYQAEAARLLDKRLPVPAYHYVLKCSQTFNVLDARGAIGTTERARAFARMRRMAHDVAVLWVDRRAELGFPLGVHHDPPAPPPVSDGAFATDTASFLLEVGTEELPPADVDSAVSQLRRALEDAVDRARLSHGAVEVEATPRRVVATIAGVGPRQPDRTVVVRGPRADRAFAADGTPTPAALGFARKQGFAVDELGRVEEGGVAYLIASRVEPGQAAGDVLASLLAGVVESLHFERTMRWGAGPVAFSRPIRWLLALLGNAVVPFSYGDLASGRTTRVLRDDDQPTVDVTGATDYPAIMAAHAVTVGRGARQAVLLADAVSLAASVGGAVDPDGDSSLVDEVTNLVENPVVLLGNFDPSYLNLPAEVLTTVMKKHQRYLPVRSPAGDLLPAFVAVANGPIDVDVVRAGNEAVLRARYADAAFFFERDLSRPLSSFRAGLATLTFEERAGSMLDRSDHTSLLAGWLALQLGLSSADRSVLERAAFLAKADLATEMVVELSSLAGQMGRVYALRQTPPEPDEVAEAIFEATLPRQSGDRLPKSTVGAVLAIADRADALAALFAVGAQPSGSADPYGLRRAASGLIAIVLAHHLPVDLRALFAAAAAHQAVAISPAATEELLDFVRRRLEQRLLDEGHRADLVRSVLGRSDQPARAVDTLAELEALWRDEEFRTVATALRRCLRIAGPTSGGAVDADLFEDPAEAALWSAFQRVALSSNLREFVAAFAPLVDPINTFFEQVMVMAEDRAVRANRLHLLSALVALGAGLGIDWNAIVDL